MIRLITENESKVNYKHNGVSRLRAWTVERDKGSVDRNEG